MAGVKRPDRVDFSILSTGMVIVRKYDHIAEVGHDDLLSSDEKPVGFDTEKALTWCEAHGYVVRRWPGGARVWKAERPWPIRTRSQIKRLRERVETEVRAWCQAHPGQRTESNRMGLDFALDY